jgi:RNA-binding protein 39
VSERPRELYSRHHRERERFDPSEVQQEYHHDDRYNSRDRQRSHRDHDRDRYSSRRRSRSRSADRKSRSSRRHEDYDHRRTSRRRSPTPPPPVENDEEYALPSDPMQRKMAQADRDARTVFVTQIHPRVTMRQIYEFFSQVVKVTDIQVIEDARTHKSKGLAYVEVFSKDMVPMALAMNGHLLCGYPCCVQISQADRIRMASDLSTIAIIAASTGPTRLHVSGLDPKIVVDDLKPLFEVFGECSVSLSVNPATNQSDGVAFVSYKQSDDARTAQKELNGEELLGKAMKVVLADEMGSSSGSGSSRSHHDMHMNLGELDDDSGGGLPLTAQSRVALMQRLQRNSLANSDSMNPANAQTFNIPKMKATTCLILKNMFDPNEETNPDFDLEIREDVSAEASRFGRLNHIYVDRESNGNVFLRYGSERDAEEALKAFNGRWFASRQIVADFVPEATYNLRFPESARH